MKPRFRFRHGHCELCVWSRERRQWFVVVRVVDVFPVIAMRNAWVIARWHGYV